MVLIYIYIYIYIYPSVYLSIYLSLYVYIYLLRNNVRLLSKITKHGFFCCANISQPFRSVASSVQVALQFYFQIFYSTAPSKIAIRLKKLKNKLLS